MSLAYVTANKQFRYGWRVGLDKSGRLILGKINKRKMTAFLKQSTLLDNEKIAINMTETMAQDLNLPENMLQLCNDIIDKKLWEKHFTNTVSSGATLYNSCIKNKMHPFLLFDFERNENYKPEPIKFEMSDKLIKELTPKKKNEFAKFKYIQIVPERNQEKSGGQSRTIPLDP